MKRVYFFVLLVVVLCCAGCGSGKVKLTGKVTFEDGKVLSRGIVIFDNGTIASRGRIESDGTYVVGTDRDNDGIRPGAYKVYIAGAVDLVENPRKDFPPTEIPLIDPKFTSTATSGLSTTIGKSPTTYNITVIPPPK